MAFNVIRLGFEPKTHSLEGCCSIQLSYRTEPYFFRKWVQRYAFSFDLQNLFLLAEKFADEFDAGDEGEAD